MNVDPAWVGVGLLFITSLGSSLYTVRRNNKNDLQTIKADAVEFGILKKNVSAMQGDVADIKKSLSEGLTTVGKEVQNMQVKCATVSTGLNQRVLSLEEQKKREEH